MAHKYKIDTIVVAGIAESLCATREHFDFDCVNMKCVECVLGVGNRLHEDGTIDIVYEMKRLKDFMYEYDIEIVR